MTQKPDNETIQNALESICEHPLFANSYVYNRLLHYLVEKAVQKEDIKEYTIGADLFGKNYLGDKNDGTVRSHMYKLRKKLATYYTERSTQTEVIFEIKKGQYNLTFITPKQYRQTAKKPTLTIPIKHVQGSAAIVFVVLLAVLAIKVYTKQAPFIWDIFFQKNAHNLVVISDQYIVMATAPDGQKNATMYMEINNDQQLLAYKSNHPDRMVDATDFTLMSKMAPFSIKYLDEWFLDWKRNFKLELESDLTLNDIKENNLVFVGQFKTMNLSKSFFLQDSKAFSIYRDGFKYHQNGNEKIYNTQFGKNGKVEYALVSFTSISPGKKALYFVSNNDIGVMATLRNFTDKQWLKEFDKKIPKNTAGFNALFEVSGLQRTDMSCKLVELEPIVHK